MEVSFIKHLRGEEKFADIEALVRQIRKDVEDARHALEHARQT
jgi:FAD synthase